MIVTEWASPTSAMGMPVLCSHIARTDALGKKDTRGEVMVGVKTEMIQKRLLNANELSQMLGIRRD